MYCVGYAHAYDDSQYTNRCYIYGSQEINEHLDEMTNAIVPDVWLAKTTGFYEIESSTDVMGILCYKKIIRSKYKYILYGMLWRRNFFFQMFLEKKY